MLMVSLMCESIDDFIGILNELEWQPRKNRFCTNDTNNEIPCFACVVCTEVCHTRLLVPAPLSACHFHYQRQHLYVCFTVYYKNRNGSHAELTYSPVQQVPKPVTLTVNHKILAWVKRYSVPVICSFVRRAWTCTWKLVLSDKMSSGDERVAYFIKGNEL